MKILLLENIHLCAKERLEGAGLKVQLEKPAWSEEQLKSGLKGQTALGIRSKTQISAAALKAAPDLEVIGAFCIGTNQIDLEAANELGIPVFNAPYSNTRSVAELVLAEIIALSRCLGDVSASAHQGAWRKSAAGAREVRGKTLGIIGYGHIGSQISVLAEAIGLRVIYFDVIKKLPLGNAKGMDSLPELLRVSDFVTLHVPETPQTKGMIGERELKTMKKGSYLLNASRGTVVDIGALSASLRAGHLAGCAIDVFPKEPQSNDEKFVSELQGLPNAILTPHIGGSTEEAQEAIGHEVSESLVRYLFQGSSAGAVNFPQVECPPAKSEHRLVNVHRNVPGVLGQINSVFSRVGANIEAQYLSTDSRLGYVVIDFKGRDAEAIRRDISALSSSLRTRLISGTPAQ